MSLSMILFLFLSQTVVNHFPEIEDYHFQASLNNFATSVYNDKQIIVLFCPNKGCFLDLSMLIHVIHVALIH